MALDINDSLQAISEIDPNFVTPPIIRDFYANTERIAARFSVSVKTIKAWVRMMDLPVYQKTPNSSYMIFEEDIIQKWLPKMKNFLSK